MHCHARRAIVSEVEGTLTSIYSTHGQGAWKSKLMVKDAIADITLQQVLTRAKDFDVIATLNLNGARRVVCARVCGRAGVCGLRRCVWARHVRSLPAPPRQPRARPTAR